MAAVLALLVMAPARNMAQAVLDLCGCSGDPQLRPFNAADPATYPPGTSGCTSACGGGTITLPLPPDGILRFSSFTVDGSFNIFFSRNAANTPVTILVSGDAVVRAPGCCQTFGVSGVDGSSGSSSGVAGIGGLGGPGGFRGGDAAAESVNGATIGGTGLGPGGGSGWSAAALAGGGVFFGVPELSPLVGGSGGGGGGATPAGTSCTGGGGGGGGGALLFVANGTLTIGRFLMLADGGSGGSVGNGSCASGGSGGSGGAVRLVARSFSDAGQAFVNARGGGASFHSNAGLSGRVRFESIDASAQTAFSPTPAAARVTGPTPLANAVSPVVRITRVGGQATPATPQGGYGAIDVVIPAPGVVGVDFTTSGVPSNTLVLVTLKPRIGGNPLSASVPLTDCTPSGDCTATASFNLSAGAYTAEARATFQVQ